MTSFLSFSVSSECYAVPVERVEEALRLAWPTPVAEAPPDVLGVLNLGGELLVVVDPAHRLGLKIQPPCQADFLLVLSREEDQVALKIDSIEGLIEGSPTSTPRSASAPAFVVGYLLREGSPVAVLDVDGLLDPRTAALVQEVKQPDPPEEPKEEA
ncbi:MAG: chemotaxis protein CheW [Deltaproteobacteria bacterium]|nr:chemotaxis protein CheW [Deltaproteobacteria bacterium]